MTDRLTLLSPVADQADADGSWWWVCGFCEVEVEHPYGAALVEFPHAATCPWPAVLAEFS